MLSQTFLIQVFYFLPLLNILANKETDSNNVLVYACKLTGKLMKVIQRPESCIKEVIRICDRSASRKRDIKADLLPYNFLINF